VAPVRRPVTNVTQPGHTYHRTHLGNAELLRDMVGARLRYCHPWNVWLNWTGQRWKRDDCGFAKNCASQVARKRIADAHGAGEREEIKRELAWAFSSENTAGINGTLSLAQAIADLTVLPDEFDSDPWALNVQNGILDLRTGRLGRHDPDAYHTKLAPVRWNPDATCPTFLKFLERVLPSESLRGYVQRAAGYSLTGVIREHVLFLCYGTGANGKSTWFEILARLQGGYSRTIPASLLTGERRTAGPEPELAELRGARFVRASESDDHARLSEGFVKAATGGDTIMARRCYEDPTEFVPSHKLWLGTNHRPQIRGVDLGIWRRIKMIPWTVTIPREDQDPGLLEAIMREREGILAWQVRGCLDWQRHGLGEAPEVAQATEEYRLDSDIFGQFLADRCILREDHRTDATTLRAAYNAWRTERGEKEITARTLAKELRDRGFQRLKSSSAKWIGIGLRYIQDEIQDGRMGYSGILFPEVSHEEKRDKKLREKAPPPSQRPNQDPLEEILQEGIL